MTPDSVTSLTIAAAAISGLGAFASYRCLLRARRLVDSTKQVSATPALHDTAARIRYLRALTAIGTTLDAMRANFDRGNAPVFGNVEPPVLELGELCAAAAPLGRSLDVGILHATMYWLREHSYQRAFTNPSMELSECRARIDAALWETRRLLGIAEDASLPRTLADVEALAELAATPVVAPAAPPKERGRRVAARRESRVPAHPQHSQHSVPRAAGAH